MFRFLPEQASEIASKVDSVHNLITDLSVLFTVLIVGAMLVFAFKYRRRDGKDHTTPQIKGSHFLEVVWTVVPTIICIYLAYKGVAVFKEMRTVPKDAMEIKVYASKWKWDFEYENGKKTTNEFVVPVGRPIKVLLTSRDVLHSFFLPEMRVKSDAVPGYFTYVTFKPILTGEFHTFCTEYCGKNHSAMLAKLKVVAEDEYKRWVEDKTDKSAGLPPAERGKYLYKEKGCIACHNLTGTNLVGPSFLKIYGKKGRLTDGSEYLADENYIKKSILEPNYQVVEGFSTPSQMTSFAGQITDEEIESIIAFMKTLDGTQKVEAAATASTVDKSKLTPAERGKLIYQEKACIGCHTLDGKALVGPSLKGVYGRQAKWTDGTSYTVDDAYIKESLIKPSAHVVEGFAAPSLMPPYEGQLNDDDIKDVIEFLKTVK